MNSQDIAKHVEECRSLKTFHRPTQPIEFFGIGESPPISGQYIYKAINLKPGSKRIPAQIFRAFYKKDGVTKEEYESLLKDLKDKKAFFFEDLSEFPLNDYDNRQRVKIIHQCFPEFKNRIDALKFSSNIQKILVLPKGTIDELQLEQNSPLWTSILKAIGITESQVCIFSHLEKYITKTWNPCGLLQPSHKGKY